jgi:hypothetical protein
VTALLCYARVGYTDEKLEKLKKQKGVANTSHRPMLRYYAQLSLRVKRKSSLVSSDWPPIIMLM